MESLRKNQDIKLVATENYLVSEPNHGPTNFFWKTLIAIEMKNLQIFMNKSVYLGLSISETSKNAMCEFWYNHVKWKYSKKSKLCYMDKNSFIVHLKTEKVFKDIEKDVWKRFDTSSYELESRLSKEKSKNVLGLMKDDKDKVIRLNIMKELMRLRAKRCNYLTDVNDESKTAKSTKKCVIKRKLKFKDYKKCLQAYRLENKRK